jgi:prepilin-type N-terminal cleavage/methylation domain-containing protein
MRGYSLVELLVTLAVLGVLTAMSVPMFGNALEHSRLRGAAFHMSARLYLVRSQAVRRHGYVALRFKTINGVVQYQTFADGDRDGVKSADITSGRDVPLDRPEALGDTHSGITFGFVPGCPLIDGSTASGNPVRIGTSGLLSYSPGGESTTGTLYIRSRSEGYAIVLLGATGRTRLLYCSPTDGRWTIDGR